MHRAPIQIPDSLRLRVKSEKRLLYNPKRRLLSSRLKGWMGPSKKKRAETGKAPVHRRRRRTCAIITINKTTSEGRSFPFAA